MTIRFTADEFQRLQDRMNVRAKKALDSVANSAARRNKYGAKATVVDGRRFDSKSEAKRYLQLKAMQQAGEIEELELQVQFDLIPGLDVGGRKENPVRYVADFRYKKDGETIIEDTKSSPTKTKEYTIKRKLMLWIHGIAIREVLING